MQAFILATISSILITFGQVLWKIAIDKNGGLINPSLTLRENFLTIFLSPYMLSGLVIYSIATLFWMYLLGKYQYSYIYPMMSITYIFSFFFAIFLFGETVSLQKWIGVFVIISGIFLIGSDKFN